MRGGYKLYLKNGARMEGADPVRQKSARNKMETIMYRYFNLVTIDMFI
jgi:hypothetical protein